jgi:two-component system sensor histidine kinase AtoS
VKEDGTTVYANEMARRLLGEHQPEALQRFARSLLDVPERADGPATQRIDVETPAGTSQLVLKALHVEQAGGLVILLDDRTRLAALEASTAMAALQQSRRLWRSHVHDLMSPLNSVTINLRLLQNSLAKEGSEEQVTTARILGQEIARLNRFLDSFFRQVVSPVRERPEEGRPADLRHLVREVVRLVRPSAGHAHIRLRTELPSSSVDIEAADGWLQQALLHILLNSIEAQPHGGEIRILLAPESGRARILVEDDGPGIPAAHAQRIFEMGFTTKNQGGGIGLTVACSFVEALGGQLTLDSRPGGGTTASITIPTKVD